jgi:hypothetical protein
MEMPYAAFADLVVAIHFAFVVFVVLGGVLALKWTRFAWVHIPAAAWGIVIEFAGWVCPLTPLENWLREKGGAPGYSGSFVEHYLEPLLYPVSLTRARQIVFGVLALTVNIGVYGYVACRSFRTAKSKRSCWD